MGVLLSQISNEEVQTKRMGQLIMKFGQLTMKAVETISEFLDRTRDCLAEIRACDPSQVLTEKQQQLEQSRELNLHFLICMLHYKLLRKCH